MDGILLLHKPKGVTSFQALSPIKKMLPGTKIGHCGTLDRFASGLLILLLGRMTRLNPVFTGLDKSYHAVFHFGYETETLDPEGAIVQQLPCPTDVSSLNCQRFLGLQSQVPPAYSAIHVDGKRASVRARCGQMPSLAPRSVYIHELSLGSDLPDVQVDVTCSKGTYIRSLARDMGCQASSCATVVALERYWIGHWSSGRDKGFFLDQAQTSQEVDPERDVLSAWQALQFLPHVPVVRALPEYKQKISQGQPFKMEWLSEPFQDNYGVVFGPDQDLLAVVRRQESGLSYDFVVGDSL